MTQVINWHRRDGFTTALLLSRGPKYLKVLPMSSGNLSVKTVPLSEERNMYPVLHKGNPYPVDRAKRIYRKHGKAYGWTKSAKDALRSQHQKGRDPNFCPLHHKL
jgi:hypothetical protein